MPQVSRSVQGSNTTFDLSVDDSSASSGDYGRQNERPEFSDEVARFNILADESVDDTAEYTDAEYKQKIVTLDFVLKLQHEYIVKLGIRCIIDRLQKRKGQSIRKTLLWNIKRRRDANKERRTRILERMEDQQNERFLNTSLIGVESASGFLDSRDQYAGCIV